MHTVPQTILEQLGGRQFLMMTGAKDLVGAPDYLWFRIKGRDPVTGKTVNRVKITLRGDDTYTLEAYAMRNGQHQLIAQNWGVYADMLADTFERLTGLYTRIGAVRFVGKVG